MAEVQVKLIQKTYVPPMEPLDRVAVEGINLKLSFFDAYWVSLPPVQRLLLFEGTDLPASLSPHIQSFKDGLSATLQKYFVLAGKLVYNSSTGDVAIDCSPSAIGSGVAFIEAEADGDMKKLIGNEEHDMEAFRLLVPELDAAILPAPVFSVQVTTFKSGGVAVAFSIHHAVVDGRGVWQFIEAWSAATCRSTLSVEEANKKPIFDRRLLRHPRAEEVTREIICRRAPQLPVAILQKPFFEGRFKLERRTFLLGLHHINCLKQKVTQLSQSNASLLAPSSFVAIAAHIWVSFVRSHNFNLADDTYISILADCRSRLRPPITDWYFGNCIKGFAAGSTVGTLMQESGLLHASIAIQTAMKKSLEDALSGIDDWLEPLIKLPSERLINVAASPRFKVYDTDFGWGKPRRVELVSMNRDGEIVLVGAKDGDGVQVSVCLDRLWFDSFKLQFQSI